jgi:rod shape determining protein RodA
LVGRGQGAGRWLVWGVFHVQPAEIAKVGVLLVLARFLADFNERELNQVFPVLSAFLLVMLPLILVLQQPDLSSALVFGAIVLPMLYWAGLSLFAIFTIIAPVVTILAAFQIYTFFAVMVIITIVLIISRRGVKTVLLNFFVNVLVGIWPPYIWNHLHQYQQKRILAFLGLEFDPQGSGYQVIQSQVAIGSGGIVGKGFLHGTQTRLHFLPAQHTDFIVSVVGEEFGFLGILLVLGLFLYLLLYAVRVAERSDDRFTSLLIIGIVGIFAFHILINVGMTVGIMPVTGLPLPFLSYGGSFLVVCLIFLGLILRIERQ